MKKLTSIMMVFMVILVLTGCTSTGKSNPTEEPVPPDENTVSEMQEGFIFEIKEGSVLVLDNVQSEDFDKSWTDIFEGYQGNAIWLKSPQAANLKVGQKVQYWIDGGVEESFPSQALAEKIEVIAERSYDNNAFRNVKATGSKGKYTITGEGRVFEATMNYAVSDGHNYLLENFMTLDMGAPEWSAFTLEIQISEHMLPTNGTLMLELFELSAKDGSVIHLLAIPLESFQ
ncbi:DUF3221 domain-containing protein [Paenibacillus sp. CMAA1364]